MTHVNATTSDGTRISYRVVGDGGRTVVLLQGLGLSGRFWFGVPEELCARVAASDGQSVRVVVVDNRGTGGSTRPTRPFSMGDLADDTAAVLDALAVESAYVAGISMGGMIALQLALRHPGRVRGLVLMATSAGLPCAQPPSMRMVSVLLRATLARGPRAMHYLAKLLLPPHELGNAALHLAQWPDALKLDPPGVRTLALQLGAIACHATGHRLHTVRCPTAVVTGTDDGLVPPRNSRILAQRLPDATLTVLPGVGHAVPALAPLALSIALADVQRRAEAVHQTDDC